MEFAVADEAEWRQMMQMAYGGQDGGGAVDLGGADCWKTACEESDDDATLDALWGRMADESAVEAAKETSSDEKADLARPDFGCSNLEWLAPLDPDEVAQFEADEKRAGRSRRRSLSDTSASDASTSPDSSSSSSPVCCPDSKRGRISRFISPRALLSSDEGLTSVHYMKHKRMEKGMEHIVMKTELEHLEDLV